MKLVSVMSSLVIVACSIYPAPNAFPPDTGAIFPGERARELVRQCSRPSPGPVESTWTPSARQLARVEANLPAKFEEVRRARWPNDAVEATDYYRQYGGIVVDGREIIYVNGVHSEHIDQGSYAWRETPVLVCDGGPIVFGAEYDPGTNEFLDFSFNGALPAPD